MSATATPGELRLPWFAALLTAVAGGLAIQLAFPRTGWWWLAPVGVLLVLVALRGRRWWGAVGIGFAAGLALYLPLISWSSLFVGWLPWVALSAIQALWFAVGAGLIALLYRWWPRTRFRLSLLPLAVAATWLLRERVASLWPYGGFAWGRLGQSQADAPWVVLVSYVSISGLTLLLVWVAAMTLETIRYARRRGWPVPAGVGLATGSLVLGACLVPVPDLAQVGTMRVVGVQGGTEKAGFFHASRTGEVRAAHVAASLARARSADLVVWPEGAAEPDPLRDRDAAADIARVGRAYGAPVLVGAIHTDDDGLIYNTAQLWLDSELAGRYDKRRPVPFGEYVPDRWLWSIFAPREIALISREYAFGTTSPVLAVGEARVGVAICFDVIDDGLMRESVADGAQVLVYPTNNADFGATAELDQQWTFARLRAVESGRAVIQVSTVGQTGVAWPDGRVTDAADWYTPAAISTDLPLVTGATPAMVIGPALEWGASVLAMVLLLGTGAARRIRRGA